MSFIFPIFRLAFATLIGIALLFCFVEASDSLELAFYKTYPGSLRLCFFTVRLLLSCIFLGLIGSAFTWSGNQVKWIIASAIILPSFALLVLVDRGDRDFLYLGAVLVGSLFPVTFLFVRKGFSFPLGSWAVAVFACLMVALPHFLCSADLYPFQAERGEKWEGKSLDSLVVLEKEHSRIRQKKVLLFYTKDCHFCRISLRKTTAFIRRHQLDLGQFLIVSPESSREGFSDFLRNSPLPFQVEFVNGTRFFSVVRNSTPLILLQTPTGPLAWRYRDFDDTEVARQLAIP